MAQWGIVRSRHGQSIEGDRVGEVWGAERLGRSCGHGRWRCGQSIEHGTDVSRESADAQAPVSNELNPTGDCVATTSKVKDGSVTVNASRAGLDD